ncbi:MAG: hypothetical protein CFE40_01015 [Burkholderiales bacterium PBB1]|nr:MAG: hypothetical protein CFE40_01015 [Burkholderiales bacterium PBB1]
MALKNVPLSISVGILATLWTYLSIKMSLPTWSSFVSWAFFFVAGADTKAFIKAGAPILAGVVFGYLTLFGLKVGSGGTPVIAISLAVGLAALLLVIMMGWELFALTPAAFGAFAVFFAYVFGKPAVDDIYSLTNVWIVVLTQGIGLLLGYLSVFLPTLFAKKS